MKLVPNPLKQHPRTYLCKGILGFFLFLLWGQLSLDTVSVEAGQFPPQVKSLLVYIKNRNLKKFLKICATPRAKAKHYNRALALAFLEKEHPLALIQYLITRAKKRHKQLNKDFLMKKALQHAPLEVVLYLLKERIYNSAMLQGRKSYSFRKMVHTLWPRFFRSSITKKYYWFLIITSPIDLFFLLELLLSWWTKRKSPFKGHKYFDWLAKCLPIAKRIKKALFVIQLTWNAYYILYILHRLYQQGYLLFVLRGYRSQQEKKELVRYLLAHGANPLQSALFISSRREENPQNIITMYTFEEKGPIHFAIENNNLEIVKLLYQADPQTLHQMAYTMRDTKEENAFFPELISIQTLFSKEGDQKEVLQIQRHRPIDLAHVGSRIYKFLIEKGITP